MSILECFGISAIIHTLGKVGWMWSQDHYVPKFLPEQLGTQILAWINRYINISLDN